MREITCTKWLVPDDGDEVLAQPVILHCRKRIAPAAIVFVHGLNAKRYKTWGRFPELLFGEFSDVDIAMYGYRTGYGRLQFWRSISLEREAQVLLSALRQMPHEGLFLFGHSMGGLLTKIAIQLLIYQNDQYHLKRIAGLFLFATPQAGSNWILPVLSWISKDMRALASQNELLRSVHDTFQDRVCLEQGESDRFVIPTWSVEAAEDFWVTPLSAGLGLPTSHRKVVRGTHSEIVNPPDRQAQIYRWVADRVQDLLKIIPAAIRLSSPLQSALEHEKNFCQLRNVPFYGLNCLLAALMNEETIVYSILTKSICSRIKMEVLEQTRNTLPQHYPGRQFEDFVWREQPEIRTAQEFAARYRASEVSEAMLVLALLESSRETGKWLRRLLGTETERIIEKMRAVAQAECIGQTPVIDSDNLQGNY